MKTAVERFLNYIQTDTTSIDDAKTYPSSPNQLVLGKAIAEELRELGLQDVEQDQYGYVTGTVPATAEGAPVIGLISHFDTSNAVAGGPIHPQFVDYKGGDVVLNADKQIVMTPDVFPDLKAMVGKRLIMTDGTTLLGADDKAGVAEIVTLAERMMNPAAPKHGKIRIAFTPDEEVGNGTEYFDLKKFGADVAYTVDGGALGELEYENFNAALAVVTINGVSVHTGDAKGQMINAAAVGCEFQNMLPEKEQPVYTEGYEGFYHLSSFKGSVEHCELKYLLREHDSAKFQAQKDKVNAIAAALNKKWGEGVVSVAIKDQYLNMRPVIEQHMELVEEAKKAFEACGVTVKIQPIRGGTDGARLSRMGLPCPNLSTGGYLFHSRYEFIPEASLGTMVDVLEKLVCGLCGSGK
ncbi:MAG: peptidase T [Acidaminococcus sp.]|jgi:tripeptide aminopeptidase|nr:peptidase T [Acidaminococcus sp.]MCI2100550.1 peptidase T [Acidaminococcus sp.]MCI2114871.1 peptidase T [Acidaminococcus sp.]MCI2117548.1 peptidase T [Acidaminococcus sp.]